MVSRQACRPPRKIKVLVPVEAPVNARPVEGPVVPLRLWSMLPPSKKKGEGHELGRLLHLGPESPLRQQESPDDQQKKLVASVLATSLSMTAGIETIFEPITEFDVELQQVLWIKYSVWFHQETAQVLFGLGIEVNVMHQRFAENRGLCTEKG